MDEVQNINQYDNVDAPVQQELYSIAIGKEKRVINRPKKFANVIDKNLFGYENCMKSSWSVAKSINMLKPNSCKKSYF